MPQSPTMNQDEIKDSDEQKESLFCTELPKDRAIKNDKESKGQALLTFAENLNTKCRNNTDVKQSCKSILDDLNNPTASQDQNIKHICTHRT